VKTGERQVAMTTIPYPDEPGAGQALIRTTLSTICGSDIHIVDELPVPAGVPMGHEATGVVEAVGTGVTGFRKGDRVVVSCLPCCGQCARCMEGTSRCARPSTRRGTCCLGRRASTSCERAQTSMAKIPDSLEDELALFASDIMSTGFGALERADIRLGDTVAIFAQGPVGLCATAGARALGQG
jgi:threonine dehydrogenase-like Zn-dependent dehydrogenase